MSGADVPSWLSTHAVAAPTGPVPPSIQTRTQMAELVLVVPLQVQGHVAELQEERVQVLATVIAL